MGRGLDGLEAGFPGRLRLLDVDTPDCAADRARTDELDPPGLLALATEGQVDPGTDVRIPRLLEVLAEVELPFELAPGLVVVADLAGGVDQTGESLGAAPLLVAGVVAFVGLLALAGGYGLWKLRRWAWMLALVLSGFSVFQPLLALASGGFSGLVSVGIVPAAVALAIFYYLTRPYVAAAFGRKRAPRRGPGV